MQNNSKLTGSCLCGAIRYEAEHIEPAMAHCHCSMCRKFHGAAYSTFAEIKHQHFRWLCGEEQLASYTAANGSIRRFCRVCGSSLTFSPDDRQTNVIQLALGTLDSHTDRRPDAHIHVASKAGWDVICDGLPQYTQGRNSRRCDKASE